MPEKLAASVIIASYNARTTIEACLRALERQPMAASFEVIVVDSSTDGTGEFVEAHFPHVKVYRFQQRKFPGDARNIGISKAMGRIIAVTDADCQPDRSWIEQIIKAHDLPYPAIGGAIANANPASPVGWAAYFCEFSQWMPGTLPTWMDDAPAANISYKKDVFDRYGTFVEGTYCSDTEFHWRLRENGHRVRFDPLIRVAHRNIDHLARFLKHEAYHGRSFARVRIRAQGFSWLKRLVYVALLPLIPLRLFLKVALCNFRSRVYLAQFVKSSPLVLLGLVCWSVGEGVGYATGQ